ncbi:hypothetical protein LTR95_017348 [Oleoguttula sp. CCFEE 5521]
MAQDSTAFIRPISLPSDRSALDHIFRVTCGESLKTEPSWTISSYLWCHPYPLLSPSTCFVLDPGNSEGPVGYILSTPNTRQFAKDWTEKYVPSLDRKLLPEPDVNVSEAVDDKPTQLLQLLYGDPEKALNFSYPGLVDTWPGHLHIDILPSHQGQGWGRKLIDTLLEALRAEGCKGVHLGMEAGSLGALKFYTKLGFSRYPEVLNGGVSGETGRTGGEGPVLYLVKDILI